jgi:MFS family permease
VSLEPGKRAATLAALAIAPGVLFAGVAGGLAFPILPIVGLRAGLSLPFIGLILAANRIARVVSSPAVGALCDRLGGRRLLIVGLLTQVVVMALYVAGIKMDRPGPFFLVARIVHGPGSASVFVAAQVLALHAGGDRHGGTTSGVVRAAMTAGVPLGLVLGGLLSARYGDAVAFEAAIGAVLLAAAAAFALVPDLRAPGRPHAPLRALVHVMTHRHVLALGAVNLVTFFSVQGAVLTTLVLLIHARGLSFESLGDQATASLAMAGLILLSGVASIIAGRLGDRYHAHSRFAVLGVLVTIAGLLTMTVASTPAALLGATGLVGLGAGAVSPCLVALIGLFVEGPVRGAAVGAVQLLGDVGGSLGPVIGAALLARSTGAPFWVSALVMVGAIPAALWLAREERDRARAVESPPSDDAGLSACEM